MPTILILTHSEDDTATMVTNHLDQLDAKYVRFDTDMFPGGIGLTMLQDSFGHVNGTYHFPNEDLPFSDIGVVWNRRVRKPTRPEELAHEPELQDWAVQESQHALANSFTLIDAPVMNPWDANERIKFNKMVQMKRAAELGLMVPRTCLSNVSRQSLDFCESEKRHSGVVVKKIRKGLITLADGTRLLLHTAEVPEANFTLEGLMSAGGAPLFLQEHVQKKHDIRSIVVGDKVFSIEIHSQEESTGRVDLRSAQLLGKKLKHEIIDLGEEVNSRLIAFTKSFGLTFSAIDLVRAQDDELYFLEDNPNGQWGWLEQETGVPIARAIAEHLISTVTSLQL